MKMGSLLYLQIGKRVNEEALKGKRAEYGRQIVVLLARQLGTECGRGSEQKAIASLSSLLFFQGRGCIKNNRQKYLERTEALLW